MCLLRHFKISNLSNDIFPLFSDNTTGADSKLNTPIEHNLFPFSANFRDSTGKHINYVFPWEKDNNNKTKRKKQCETEWKYNDH